MKHMRKPLILLTPRAVIDSYKNRTLYDNSDYFQYVQENGGIPVLASEVTQEDAIALAKQLDGLLITGGEDLDPSYYHETNTHSSLTDKSIDETDYYLYQAFRQIGKPILGICRGLQVINAFEGGTLMQDILTQSSSYSNHNQREYDPPLSTYDVAHSCTFVPNTKLHEIFGDTTIVNTFHHQAIKDLAPGFVASSLSEDGIIEGIEKENVLAVQWHPERLRTDKKQAKLMQVFIQSCML